MFEALLMIILVGSPQYKVGDCLMIENTIMNIKIVKVDGDEYHCTYWVPWLHKYVPDYMLSIADGDSSKVHKVKCLKEKKLGGK